MIKMFNQKYYKLMEKIERLQLKVEDEINNRHQSIMQHTINEEKTKSKRRKKGYDNAIDKCMDDIEILRANREILTELIEVKNV